MKITPEFSRPIAVEGLTLDKTRTEIIEATEAECEALSKRFDLRELSDFKATINIRRVTGGMVKVDGTVKASVVQACVVSLQKVYSEVDAKFETYFTENPDDLKDDDELIGEDDEDVSEMISEGIIDMGEVAAQYLSLEIDPYPRAPGVSLAAQLAGSGLDVKSNPFQVLERLKDDKKDKK